MYPPQEVCACDKPSDTDGGCCAGCGLMTKQWLIDYILYRVSNELRSIARRSGEIYDLLREIIDCPEIIDDKDRTLKTISLVLNLNTTNHNEPYWCQMIYLDALEHILRPERVLPVTPVLVRDEAEAISPAGERRKRRPISVTVKRAVWARDRGRCRTCGISDSDLMERDGEHLQYGHVIAFSKNGADTVNNIMLQCRPCNISQGTE